MADDYSKSVLDYLKNPVDYVSGGDGQLFINYILVDECYDIQYSYREMKEPVYGYRSTHFSDVLHGTVLITGQFTINYIHDGYLWSILNAGKTSLTQTGGVSDVISKGKSSDGKSDVFSQTFQDGLTYKTTLEQYNELRKYIDSKYQENKDIESKMAILNETMKGYDTKSASAKQKSANTVKNITNQMGDWASGMWYDNINRVSAAEGQYDTYSTLNDQYVKNKNLILSGNYSSVSFPSSKIENISSWGALASGAESETFPYNLTYINKLLSLNEQYGAEAKSYISNGFFNNDAYKYAQYRQQIKNAQTTEKNTLKGLSEQKKQLQKRKNVLDSQKTQLDKAKDQLAILKASLNNPTVNSFMKTRGNYKEIDSLKLQQAQYSSSKNSDFFNSRSRPEDADPFVFQIRFNGLDHKKLIGVHLIGHSHMFGVGGEPIKETYTFLAQRLG